MIILCFKTSDEAEIEIACEYWHQEADGNGFRPVADLAKSFRRTAASINGIVRKTCIAHATEFRCTCCKNPVEVVSRAAYQQLVDYRKGTKTLLRRSALLCNECHEIQLNESLKKQQEEIERKCNALETWLSNQANIQPKSYADAPLKEAFLLYGVLSSACINYSKRRSTAWEYRKPPLFSHPTDTRKAYEYLFHQKWIAPCQSSPRQAFVVTPKDEIDICYEQANWLLAPDATGISPEEILLLLDAKLKSVLIEETYDIWRWVCLSELRAYFEEIHDRFRFRSKGWTSTIEQNISLLLHQCSLAQAKGIIWSSIKNLASLLQDSHYETYIVYNMIPSSFLKTLDRATSNGRELKCWDRPTVEREASLTSLLFDKVLRTGDTAYKTISGEFFKDKNPNKISPIN